VRTRRDRTTIFYSLENDHVRQLVIDAVFNAEHAGPGVPRHHRGDSGLKAVSESASRLQLNDEANQHISHQEKTR